MFTSSIDPAFPTQTSPFTEKYLAGVAFAMVISLPIDIGAQLKIWRVIVGSLIAALLIIAIVMLRSIQPDAPPIPLPSASAFIACSTLIYRPTGQPVRFCW